MAGEPAAYNYDTNECIPNFFPHNSTLVISKSDSRVLRFFVSCDRHLIIQNDWNTLKNKLIEYKTTIIGRLKLLNHLEN